MKMSTVAQCAFAFVAAVVVALLIGSACDARGPYTGPAWASPNHTAISGDTPIVALNVGAEPITAILVVAQKGIPHPASYQAESIALISTGSGGNVWAVTWRVPGASYPVGLLGASASFVFADASSVDLPARALSNYTVAP